MCISLILYNLPVILWRYKIFHYKKKKCGVNYNQRNALIFSWYRVWVFPPSSLTTYFLFSFWSGYKSKKIFLAHALTFKWTFLVWINIIILWQYSIQKDPLICKRHSKTRNKQAFRSSRWQMFYKIDVLENFAKFTGKYLSRSHFLIKLHALRDSITSVFLGPLWNFQEHLIMKHLAQQK